MLKSWCHFELREEQENAEEVEGSVCETSGKQCLGLLHRCILSDVEKTEIRRELKHACPPLEDTKACFHEIAPGGWGSSSSVLEVLVQWGKTQKEQIP